MHEKLNNFAGRVTEQDWREAALAALKGRPIGVLEHTNEDGDRFGALAESQLAAAAIKARPANTPWRVSQVVFAAPADEANEQALADLDGGAGELNFILDDHPLFPGKGLRAPSPQMFERLLRGVMVDLITLRLSGGLSSLDGLRALFDCVAGSGIAPADAAIAGSFDPIAIAFACGAPESIETLQAGLVDLIAERGAAFSRSRPFLCDGRIWHGFGATAAQELALVLAGFIDTLRAAEARGMDVETCCRHAEFAFAADADQLSTIAKFRAGRRLCAQVLRETGLAGQTVPVHAETGWRMMSLYDQNVNILRSTLAVFGAATGGADSIAVLPHSLTGGVPDALALRMARNTQLVLAEESNLHRVADPAFGSGAIESRTDALAERAWGLFQAFEASGGLQRAVRSGTVREMLAKAQAARQKRVAMRQDKLVGVSVFAVPGPERRDIVGEPAPSMTRAGEAGAAAPSRLSEPFERLRMAAESRAATDRPDIFLANLGDLTDFAARANWARALFEAGGLAVAGETGFSDMDAMAAAFARSGARAACLCGRDAAYGEHAGAAATALRDAGVEIVYIAGRPDRIEGSDRWAGPLLPVHEGMDMLSVLQDLHNRLKIGRRPQHPSEQAADVAHS